MKASQVIGVEDVLQLEQEDKANTTEGKSILLTGLWSALFYYAVYSSRSPSAEAEQEINQLFSSKILGDVICVFLTFPHQALSVDQSSTLRV